MGRMNARLACIVGEGTRQRRYLEPTREHEQAAVVERPPGLPDAELSTHPQYMGTPRYGLTRFADLFTNRQHTLLDAFTHLVDEARERVLADGGSLDYASAVVTYLGLALGRIANRSSSQSFWDPGPGKVQQVFARQALPMIWVFAEANPFSDSSGNALGQIEYLAKALEATPAHPNAHVEQRDAMAISSVTPLLVSTDPPYYDNVPYADLSDFFYVLLRKPLSAIEPDLFSTLLTPKSQELVADVQRFGGRQQARRHFEDGMATVLAALSQTQDTRFPMTLFYAFKQSEGEGDNGIASTGWETFLEAVLRAGLSIDGTWPMRTEQQGGLREHGRNSLASSIVLVCRRRAIDASITTRRDFVDELRAQLPEALLALQHGNVAPVDLAQASIGPGMGVFSRFGKVVEADGSSMSVRTALALINQVLDEILAQQEGDFDGDTRFAIAWFEEHGHDEGPFGKAETLSKAKNVSIAGLVEAGIVQTRAPKVRLLPRDQLDAGWDPSTDRRLTVWEVTQHLVGRLEVRGEAATAELLQRVGGLGEIARELAYRLYTICERKGWAQEALGYNALVVSWPEISRLASEQQSGRTQQTLGV